MNQIRRGNFRGEERIKFSTTERLVGFAFVWEKVILRRISHVGRRKIAVSWLSKANELVN